MVAPTDAQKAKDVKEIQEKLKEVYPREHQKAKDMHEILGYLDEQYAEHIDEQMKEVRDAFHGSFARIVERHEQLKAGSDYAYLAMSGYECEKFVEHGLTYMKTLLQMAKKTKEKNNQQQ